jgi:hypothetical protein
MDESGWLTSTNLPAMLAALGAGASERKLRLFAVAACRAVWELMPDGRSRRAVEVAERFAEGEASPEELAAAHAGAWEVIRPKPANYYQHMAGAVHDPKGTFAHLLQIWNAQTGQGAEQAATQAHLLRDVFGNPHRPVAVGGAPWLTPTVAGLARAAYEERSLPDGALDRVRLAILADALEEAGCPEGALLEHLRSAGLHVRGCFAVDALLALG